MYSLGVREKQLARERSLAAIERRHNTGKRNHARADRITEGAFGKTREMMANDAKSRRQEWLMNTLTEPDLNPATAEGDELSFHEHTFRDRHPELEVGNANGHVSARKYVPRVHYRGGGMLDRGKTMSLHGGSKSDQTVNLIDPRASTCSLYDAHTMRGRIQQAPYEGGVKYLLREREPAKELHPPLHFRAKNDLERVNETLAKNTINDDGEWEEPPVMPTWRSERPQRWLGGRFQNVTTQAHNHLAFMDHHKYPRSILASESCVDSPGSVHAIKDKMAGMRDRHKGLELDGDFHSVVPPNQYLPKRDLSLSFVEWKRDYPARPYHASLKSIPSMMD